MMRLLCISLWTITPAHTSFFWLTSKYIGVFGRFLLQKSSCSSSWSFQYSTSLLILPYHQCLVISRVHHATTVEVLS